jgi:hypothetical protein
MHPNGLISAGGLGVVGSNPAAPTNAAKGFSKAAKSRKSPVPRFRGAWSGRSAERVRRPLVRQGASSGNGAAGAASCLSPQGQIKHCTPASATFELRTRSFLGKPSRCGGKRKCGAKRGIRVPEDAAAIVTPRPRFAAHCESRRSGQAERRIPPLSEWRPGAQSGSIGRRSRSPDVCAIRKRIADHDLRFTFFAILAAPLASYRLRRGLCCGAPRRAGACNAHDA